jgi:hypothetical protein
MVYDSSLINVVRIDRSQELKSARDTMCTIVTFLGWSGKESLGIDVTNKVTEVKKRKPFSRK